MPARLREHGISAEASRQAARGIYGNQQPLWRIKAGQEGRLRTRLPRKKTGASARLSRAEAHEAWRRITLTLANSESRNDQLLAKQIAGFVRGEIPVRQVETPRHTPQRAPARSEAPRTLQRGQSPIVTKSRDGPELER